jgi:hypothetical protein
MGEAPAAARLATSHAQRPAVPRRRRLTAANPGVVLLGELPAVPKRARDARKMRAKMPPVMPRPGAGLRRGRPGGLDDGLVLQD